MMIGMVGFWALLIWGTYYAVAQVTGRETPQSSSAVDILEQRFARGEIDLDELVARRRTLQGN